MLAQFALRLVCGISLMWSLMPRRQVTSGFFRIQMLLALGISVVAALTIGRSAVQHLGVEPVLSAHAGFWMGTVLGVLCFLGSIVWTLERRRAGSLCVLLIAGLSLLALLLRVISWETWGTLTGHVRWLGELSSAAVLGGAVTGMLLGHWYLTAPTMSIAPLSRLNVYFGAAAFSRLILSAIGLWMAWDQLDARLHLMWLALRWLAGIGGPLVVCLMVWRILKYRHTQAATGVFFVGVILTFIGELTGMLLSRELGLPL